MSRPNASNLSPSSSSPRTGPLGAHAKAPINPSGQAGGQSAPRRSAGGLPGLARTASTLRQNPSPSPNPPGSSPSFPSSLPSHPSLQPLLSLPAHLRASASSSSAPRIPSPLGRGTPGRASIAKQSFPVRTSKVTQKHVLLPEEPQTRPLPAGVPVPGGGNSSGPNSGSQSLKSALRKPLSQSSSSQTGSGSGGPSISLLLSPDIPLSPSKHQIPLPPLRRSSLSSDNLTSTSPLTHQPGQPSAWEDDPRSPAEKQSKAQRSQSGLARLTAYATADVYRMKVLQAFLKREHGVGVVRVFDDAVYAVYNLPLLPGYGASTKVRSSPTPKKVPGSKEISLLERMNLAEEVGYHDGFFPHQNEDGDGDGNGGNGNAGGGNNNNEGGGGEAGNNSSKTPDLTHSNEYLLSSSPPPHLDIERDRLGEEGIPSVGLDIDEVMRFRLPEAREGADGLAISPEDPFVRALAVAVDQDQLVDLGDGMGELGSSAPTTSSSEETPTATDSEAEGMISASELAEGTQADYPTSGSDKTLHSTSPPPELTQQLIKAHPTRRARTHSGGGGSARVAEVVFFEYGVTVFFGLTELEERDILEDCQSAGCWGRSLDEADWEVEECHYVYDPDASYPRIYNDMFTFTSSSHLLKLSVSHAIAQSTKLSVYETVMQESLASTSSFPKELATTGHLSLGRKEALKMTGRLFRLRMDVNLSSGILDTPELFWSEASLLPLYEAIRDYLEIGPRVQVLNDRLAISGDLLEFIHGYIDQGAMQRITWIIIGLIIIACVVAFGEVTARILFYRVAKNKGEFLLISAARGSLRR